VITSRVGVGGCRERSFRSIVRLAASQPIGKKQLVTIRDLRSKLLETSDEIDGRRRGY
jgi:hypothetical protein